MVNIVILDDEYISEEDMHARTWQSYFDRNSLKSKVTIYSSPNILLDEIEKFSLNTILILDLKMDEKNGLDVLHEIRRKHIHIPVIIYSGTITEDMYDRMAQDNLFTYVKKVNREKILEAVTNALELLEDAIPLELAEALSEYLERKPERKEKKINTKDGGVITFNEIVNAINSNSEVGIDYQKAMYKMAFEALLDGEKKL